MGNGCVCNGTTLWYLGSQVSLGTIEDVVVNLLLMGIFCSHWGALATLGVGRRREWLCG